MVCGGLRGHFDTKSMQVVLQNGKMVSPTEFERLAGKGASKKWKVGPMSCKSPIGFQPVACRLLLFHPVLLHVSCSIQAGVMSDTQSHWFATLVAHLVGLVAAQASVRVDKGGGVPGMIMGEWLVGAGLETAKVVAPKTSLNALRRRAGGHGGRPPSSSSQPARAQGATGTQRHRSGCQTHSLPRSCCIPPWLSIFAAHAVTGTWGR